MDISIFNKKSPHPNPPLPQQPRQAFQIKSRSFDFVDLGIDAVIHCFAEVGFFQIASVKDSTTEVRTLKTGLLQFGLGKIYFEQSAVGEPGFFEFEIKEIAVVQLAMIELKFHQKRIGRVEVDTKYFTSLKPDILKTNFEDLGIAQVAVTEGAVFEA